jgi:hypothetical protein
MKWKLCEEKNHSGADPGNSLSKNKASYKTLVLTYPYAVVIPLTLTRSPS